MSKRHLLSWTLVCVLSALTPLAFGQTPPPDSPAAPGADSSVQVPLYYYNGDVRVDVVLRLDQLIVDTSSQAANRVTADLKSVVPEAETTSLRGGRYTLITQNTSATTRSSLQTRAAALRAAGYEVSACLYMTAERSRQDDSVLLILDNTFSLKLAEGVPLSSILNAYPVVAEESISYSPQTYIMRAVSDDLAKGLEIANGLYESGQAAFATPMVKRMQFPRFLPNDPRFNQQWHLHSTIANPGLSGNDVNIFEQWDTYRGRNINIGVVDDGVDETHPDLPNRTDLSYDYVDGDDNPQPTSNFDSHGTGVAGVAAAIGNNNIGVTGASFEGSITGIRLTAGFLTDRRTADALQHLAEASADRRVHIYNNSWGPPDTLALVETFGPLTEAALVNGVENGRGGLGAIYVWAAGNGREYGDNVNFDGYASSRYSIGVSATNGSGGFSYYSEPGASILVNSPSSDIGIGITTTNLVANGSYRNDFGGTSSSAPLVSGCIGLILEANPNLGWRDVQHILVHSSFKNDPGNEDWKMNGAGNLFNHNYGFGRIDTGAAVALAETWINKPENAVPLTQMLSSPEDIPERDPDGVSQMVTISSPTPDFVAEAVEVDININHSRRGDLEITLTAPSGMVSKLATRRPLDTGQNLSNWKFTSVAHWGEDPNGVWTLNVVDARNGQSGTLENWSLRIHGYDEVPACDVVVPDDFATIQQAIDSATDGCLITVKPGTYEENIHFGGKNLILRSTDPQNTQVVGTTLIVGTAKIGPVVTFGGAETSEAVLSGFTIVGGSAPKGGGVLGNGASPVIEFNRISGNTAAQDGGGIHGCNGPIRNNIFVNNNAGNEGGAIANCGGPIQNDTVVGNSAVQGGGGLASCTGTLANLILWDNSAAQNPQILSSSTPDFSLIQNWPGGGTGNTSSDPSFIDPTNGNYHLQANSPAIDTGKSVPEIQVDIDGDSRGTDGRPGALGDGSDYDMGADEFVPGGSVLAVTPPSQNVGAASGNAMFTVRNDGDGLMPWTATVTAGMPWLSISDGVDGVNEGVITVAYQENTSPTPRSGTIQVQAAGASNTPVEVVVNQSGQTGPRLGVDPPSRNVDYQATSVTFAVRNIGSDSMPWTATVTAGPFVTITGGATGTNDGTITVSVNENPAYSSRSATIRIDAGAAADSPQDVTIVQEARPRPQLVVSPLSRDVMFEGGTVAFDVSNAGADSFNYSTAVTQGNSWLTVTGGGAGSAPGVIQVTAALNPTPNARLGRVQVTAPGADGSPTTVNVLQEGNPTPILSVTPDSRTIDHLGGNVSFNVQNAGASLMNWVAGVQTGGDWLSVTDGLGGQNTGNIVVTAQANNTPQPRSGVVLVQAPGAINSPKQVTVIQNANPAPRLKVSPTHRDVDSSEGQTTFDVSNSGLGTFDYISSVISGQAWLRIVTGAAGANMGTITVGFYENNGGDARTGAIEVNAGGVADSPRVITVKQSPSACPTPGKPMNVKATDGTLSDRVQVTWDAVEAKQRTVEYRVFRALTNNFAQAQPLSDWVTATQFSDTTAAAGVDPNAPDDDDGDPDGMQCPIQLPTKQIQYTYYWYWVMARTECAESPVSLSDRGFRGTGAKSLDAFFEVALPSDELRDGVRAVTAAGPVALRLRASDAIDPASVWGVVESASGSDNFVTWQAATPNSDDDGWAMHVPAVPWQDGEVITFTAGAATVLGDAVGPVTYVFQVAPRETGTSLSQPAYEDFDSRALDLSVEANSVSVTMTPDTGALPAPENAASATYRVGPAEAYATPQRVWLPLDVGADAGNIVAWYYHAGADAPGWYPSTNVDGWVEPDSYLVLDLDGQQYLGFLVNHGGTVSLAALPPVANSGASMLPGASSLADMLLLAFGLVIIVMGSRFLAGVPVRKK